VAVSKDGLQYRFVIPGTSGDYVGASGSCQVPNAGNLSVQISIRVIRIRISLL
jgi:hypothetical protein